MMNKQNLPHYITVASFVVFIVLGLACATTPTVPVEFSAEYREYLQPSSGNERAIDSVFARGPSSFVCRDSSHATTPAPHGAMGSAYQVREGSNERHQHETVLDQMLAEAKRQYPEEDVTIRRARLLRHDPTNMRREEYRELVGDQYVTRTRPVWDCFPVFVADVVTTSPMPAPVTHSENFTVPRATRDDIYRVARNWLDDNTQNRRIRILSEDMNRGRITGTVTAAARTNQTYIVTSTFTIDVYDARTEISFRDTSLQRTDPSLQSAGASEPIFLQSIADATLAEIVDFSTTLRSFIISRL